MDDKTKYYQDADIPWVIEAIARETRVMFGHGKYLWKYDKADLKQGAYHIEGGRYIPDKVAVILPYDSDRPIHDAENNALLLVKNYGAEDHVEKGVYSFEDALNIGNEHANEFKRQRASFLILTGKIDVDSLEIVNDMDRER